MKLGPKMAFMLRAYLLTDEESAAEHERDREMLHAGTMTQSTFFARCAARDIARRTRRRDDRGGWPNTRNKKAVIKADEALIEALGLANEQGFTLYPRRNGNGGSALDQ
jgi:hypothetical protein